MPLCSFCKTNFEFPRGVTIVQKDGSLKHFCSGKCRKSSVMGRDNKKLTWVRKMPHVEEKKVIVVSEQAKGKPLQNT